MSQIALPMLTSLMIQAAVVPDGASVVRASHGVTSVAVLHPTAATPARAIARPPSPSVRVAVAAPATVASEPLTLRGREEDARVAVIADRLAIAGAARCPAREAIPGLVLEHLSQFEAADRAAIVATLPLDRGPGVIAVTPGGPALTAGVRPGDVLLAIDGRVLPPEPGLDEPFDAARAQARADAIHALLAESGDNARTLTLLRDSVRVPVVVAPRPGCPSRVHLARSGQRNAYADGSRVLLTTGLLARLANDDEIAFVVAHELAHNILGHAAVMRGGTVRRGLGRTLGRSGAIVRQAEREADALAGALMLDAGFDPVRGAEALRRTGGTDLGIGLFTAHAPAGERIAAMRALVAERRTP